jgi:hypothetical protein
MSSPICKQEETLTHRPVRPRPARGLARLARHSKACRYRGTGNSMDGLSTWPVKRRSCALVLRRRVGRLSDPPSSARPVASWTIPGLIDGRSWPSRSKRTKNNAKARQSRNSTVGRRPGTLISGRVKGRLSGPFHLHGQCRAVTQCVRAD